MGFPQGIPPRLPAFAGEQGGILPFGGFRRTLQGAAHRLGHDLGADAGAETVHRFHRLELFLFVQGADVIGVGDLKLLAVAFHLAADHPGFALGQHPAQVIGPGMEEHQGQCAGIVAAVDLVGPPFVGGRMMFEHLERHGGHLARAGLGHLGRVAAVDDAGGQVPKQVRHQRPGGLFHRLGDAGAHTVEIGDRREQGIEDFRAHRMDS